MFAELSATSCFTFLTGPSHPEDYMIRAEELDMAGVAIADVNSVAGIVRAHQQSRDIARAIREREDWETTHGPMGPLKPGHVPPRPRAPRLIELGWGETGPKLTLVGKGVCFDTGGLDIKPAASMGLMKKDMGGSAAVLGLARMIMALDLPVQLRVLIPAVENSVSAGAFRPGDILTSRKGLTVEINNTDAEGRLVLADALALGDEDMPDLMVSMATLTGAARVAVGPDLAPFYATDEMDADALRVAAPKVADPVWEMPFWTPYDAMIEPGIADLDNAPKGGFAGSITAALFLKRFVTDTDRYVHFDIFGWQPSAAPARPVGGVGQGARALLEALPGMLKL